MIGWDWMKKWEMLEFEMVDFSLTTSHINIHLSLFKYLKLPYLPSHLPSHLLSSIMRFDFIFRMDILLSRSHYLKIKLRMWRCWWKLELIHSWEIIKWDQFPVLSFPFHVCRVKQQEILQEKRVILILKGSWRNMREILKDWKVWDEFGEYLWK